MKIVFLNHMLSESTPIYAGRSGIKRIALKSLKRGDSANSSFWELPAHSSTHIDVPRHFIAAGKTVTDFAAKDWIYNRPALLNLKIDKARLICPSDIETKLEDKRFCDLLLLKTGFEKYRQSDRYWKVYPGLHPELAVYLKKRFPKLRAVGMDFISASSLLYRQDGRLAHRKFLSQGTLLIEDMKLSTIKNTPRKVIVAPLWLEDGDGAPATIFAFL